MKVAIKGDYRARRREEYPPIGDQLDAIWKWLGTQKITAETSLIADKIMAVKAKYPRSEDGTI